MRTQSTRSAKASEITNGWIVVDAEGVVVGRLASFIALRLRGKHRADFTPHVDTGDYIVVVNADKIRVSGRKPEQKMYYRHSQYAGGLKTQSYAKLHARFPERVIEKAVRGMLPKGPLGNAMYRKLKVYKGAEHPHAAQQPQELKV